MSRPIQIIGAERLHELLQYDPSTGLFEWKESRARGAKAGDVAGSRHSHGYTKIKIDGRTYRAHRLAWLYVHGVWPTNQLDHRNGIRDDNRIENLREATAGQNHQNRAVQSNSTSRHPGVGWHPRAKRWRAHIKVGGKQIYVGHFKELSDAVKARAAAKAKHHTFQPVDREGI